MAEKDPKMAVYLSFLLSGLGQIYNGQVKKGITFITISLLAVLSAIAGGVQLIFHDRHSGSGVLLLCIGAGVLLIMGVYNIFDAYNYAKENKDKDKDKDKKR